MRGPSRASAPPGYERAQVAGAEVVAVAEVLPSVVSALGEGSLYAYAASQTSRRALHGRAPVYVAALPGGGPTVAVRHSRHGGLLAPLTGDRFTGATRAPRELAMALRLGALGIPTPTLIAYVLYPAGPLLRRSDVATQFIERSADLAAVLTVGADGIARDGAIIAAADLLVAMARGGVRHPDLNLKNILISRSASGALHAYLLDVDRVQIDSARARAAAANAARLTRSTARWRDRRAAAITDADVAVLEAAALGRTP